MFHIMPNMMLLTHFTLDVVQIEAGTWWAKFFDDNAKCIFGDEEVGILFKFHCSLFINQRAEHSITINPIQTPLSLRKNEDRYLGKLCSFCEIYADNALADNDKQMDADLYI